MRFTRALFASLAACVAFPATASCPFGFYDPSTGCTKECQLETTQVTGGNVVELSCNGGTCDPIYGCRCARARGFRGPDCDEPCDSIGCVAANTLECTQYDEVCFCKAGWWGNFCQHTCPRDVHGTPCAGHGTCIQTPPGRCECAAGFEGPACEVEFTPTATRTVTPSATNTVTPLDVLTIAAVNLTVVSRSSCFALVDVAVWVADPAVVATLPDGAFDRTLLVVEASELTLVRELRRGSSMLPLPVTATTLDAVFARDGRLGILRRVMVTGEGPVTASYGTLRPPQGPVLLQFPDCSGAPPTPAGPATPGTPTDEPGSPAPGPTGILNATPGLPWGSQRAAGATVGVAGADAGLGAGPISAWRVVSAVATAVLGGSVLLFL